MSNGMISKLKSWVTGDPFEEDVYGMDDEFEYGPGSTVRSPQPHHVPIEHHDEPAPRPKRGANLKVLGHPNAATQSSNQVVVIEPHAFEEALEIVEHLRARKSIILNLHLLDTSQSQRVVDFLSGATHALDGNQHRIGDGVFIFTPSNIVITSESQKALMETPEPSAVNESYWGIR